MTISLTRTASTHTPDRTQRPNESVHDGGGARLQAAVHRCAAGAAAEALRDCHHRHSDTRSEAGRCAIVGGRVERLRRRVDPTAVDLPAV